jgi:ribonucleoside-diphosphate reductase alpha chain
LKTTYYLRTLGATHVEKSTAFDGKLNAVKNDAGGVSLESMAVVSSDIRVETGPKLCSIDDPTCEACQ